MTILTKSHAQLTALAAFAFLLITDARVCSAQASPAAEPTNAIQVAVANLHDDSGQVMCALFASPDGYPNKLANATAKTQSRIKDGRAMCEFDNVAPGTYAIAVFHDENGSGKLATNFMGIPKEEVGASNGAKGHFGPPKFHDAAFKFPGGRLKMIIKAAYVM